jgi:voltage-gated potassium channel Kch
MRSRNSISHKIFRVLADYSWQILVVAGIGAFALGCVGYWTYLSSQHKGPSFSDVAYASMQLFFGTTMAETHLPTSLNIARFLAFIVTGWAGVTAIAALFADRIRQMRIPWMRGHVVVCGLGYKGSAFVGNLRDANAGVVVIEADANNPHIELCRSRGVPVIIGDAQLKRTLHTAGVERAARLLAVTHENAVNTEIVAVATELVASRSRGQLSCLAQITDPDLCLLLRIQEAKRTDSATALDFFNADELSARLMLNEFPIDSEPGPPHILVAHLDDLGGWLIWHAARDWYDSRHDDTSPLHVTVLDDRGDQRVRALLAQYPGLEKVCQFDSLTISARDLQRLSAHHDDAAAPPVTRAYVTAYRDEDARETALKLRHALHPAIGLVVALSRSDGVSRIIRDAQSTNGPLANVVVFPTLERICTVDLIRGGSFEAIARALHERWRSDQIAAGNHAPTWAELDESRKESSRAHARDIAAKLRSIGYELAPLRDWDAASFTLTGPEIETLAVAEHHRWMAERLADGWTLGDKDVEQKKSPYLVPFEELPDDIAELDRVLVREYLAILASVGLQIVGMTSVLGSRAQGG